MEKLTVGGFYEDKNDSFQGGFYLLLSYDYEKDIECCAWTAAYFPYRLKGGFKGASIKCLLEEDIEKLVSLGNLDIFFREKHNFFTV